MTFSRLEVVSTSPSIKPSVTAARAERAGHKQRQNRRNHLARGVHKKRDHAERQHSRGHAEQRAAFGGRDHFSSLAVLTRDALKGFNPRKLLHPFS